MHGVVHSTHPMRCCSAWPSPPNTDVAQRTPAAAAGVMRLISDHVGIADATTGHQQSSKSPTAMLQYLQRLQQAVAATGCALSAPFLCMSSLLGPIERVVRTVHVCVLLIEATCACSIHPAQPTFSTEHSSSPQQLHCSFLQRAPGVPLPQSVCRCFFYMNPRMPAASTLCDPFSAPHTPGGQSSCPQATGMQSSSMFVRV